MQAPPAEQASSFGHSVTSMLVHGDRTKPVDPVTQVRIHLWARQCVWDSFNAAHVLCQPALLRLKLEADGKPQAATVLQLAGLLAT